MAVSWAFGQGKEIATRPRRASRDDGKGLSIAMPQDDGKVAVANPLIDQELAQWENSTASTS